jgi:hypothetical protein
MQDLLYTHKENCKKNFKHPNINHMKVIVFELYAYSEQSAARGERRVQAELKEWATEHMVEYCTYRVGTAVYVEMAKEADLTTFMLTWNPGFYSTSWNRISIRETL